MRIDESMAPFVKSIERIKGGASIDEFRIGRNDPIQDAKNRLNALRSRSDERLVKVIDTQRSLIDQIQRFLSADIKSTTVFDGYVRELEKAEERARDAWKSVRENREIQDQIMKRGISL